jgi:hypothetical protein
MNVMLSEDIRGMVFMELTLTKALLSKKILQSHPGKRFDG